MRDVDSRRDTQEIPSGIVTFLFTDVEGSTRLWASDADATAKSLELHDTIVKGAIEARNGYVFGWAGDHFRGAFEDAKAAVGAAMAIQAELADADWGAGPALRVRMGLHRGRATQRDGDYFGPVPNLAARLEALAQGQQILMSDAVADVVDVETLALGQHRLRDVPDPVPVFQVGLTAFRAIRVIDPSLSTLPLPGSQLIGRAEEVARARQLLESAPMVTLTGTGGCGKTRLAVEIAYQELPSRADGCYFADLSAVSDGSELPAALSSAVRLELSSSAGGALEQVVDHLAGRDALLVLDNCEHILDHCVEFAEQLLGRSSSTALLATTRQRLEVPGERVISLGSLGHDGDAPAVELFIERAQMANPAFSCPADPDDPVRRCVADICRQLDGMPLTIELAAARVAVLTPAEILDRMEDRFRLLSGGRGRQKRRTLQATLDWSYDLLEDDEQQFFRRCGVFVGSFDLPAAVAVSGFDDYDAMDLLGSLVAKSLLSVDDGADNPTTRYRLLETIRIYAGDLLARHEEVAAARDAHRVWFESLVATPDFTRAAGLERAERWRADWANLASALEWTLASDPEAAAQLAFGCQAMWETSVPAIEGRRWTSAIRAQLEPGSWHDWMTYIDAVLAMQLDDFPSVHDDLGALVQAPDTVLEVRAQATGLLAFLSCRQWPDRVDALATQSKEICRQGELPDAFLSPAVWSESCLALYEHRHADALEGFAAAHEYALSGGAIGNYGVMTGLSLAAAQILNGQPDDARATLADGLWSLSVWDSSPILDAIALIDLGRTREAADRVLEFAIDALRGRLSRKANDALVGFAALAIAQGERERGWELLQQAAVPRTPFTIGLAEGLASRIGRGEELAAMHRGRERPLKEFDATTALQAELDRIRSLR